MEAEELAHILAARSYLERLPTEPPFILTSGRESRHYFECQRTTTFAPALPLIGAEIYRRLLPEVTAVGGRTRGADPVADAVAFYSTSAGRLVNTFSVRKEAKQHGMGRWVEGSVEPGESVAVVDDVATSGSSVIQAIERCREHGLHVVQALVLVDREEGGMEAIRCALGGDEPAEALFTFRELQALARSGRS